MSPESILLLHQVTGSIAREPCRWLANRQYLSHPWLLLKGEAKADELIAYVAERVAQYKRIRFVEVIDQILKSASGKILRGTDRAREGPGVAVVTPVGPKSTSSATVADSYGEGSVDSMERIVSSLKILSASSTRGLGHRVKRRPARRAAAAPSTSTPALEM